MNNPIRHRPSLSTPSDALPHCIESRLPRTDHRPCHLVAMTCLLVFTGSLALPGPAALALLYFPAVCFLTPLAFALDLLCLRCSSLTSGIVSFYSPLHRSSVGHVLREASTDFPPGHHVAPSRLPGPPHPSRASCGAFPPPGPTALTSSSCSPGRPLYWPPARFSRTPRSLPPQTLHTPVPSFGG